MPDLRLQRTRTAYLTDRDLGDENDYDRWRERYIDPVAAYITQHWIDAALLMASYGSEQPTPDTRCPCGAGLNEPHAPECWQTQEPGYGMGV